MNAKLLVAILVLAVLLPLALVLSNLTKTGVISIFDPEKEHSIALIKVG